MKTLKQLLEANKPEVPQPSAPIEPDSITAYVPKTKDEKRFMDKHVIKKTDDVNGNGDDHFRATNIKVHDRSKGHGYNKGEDQKVYESKTLTQILGEKHLTAAEENLDEEYEDSGEEHPKMWKHVSSVDSNTWSGVAKHHGKNLPKVVHDLEKERDSIKKKGGNHNAISNHDHAIMQLKQHLPSTAKQVAEEADLFDVFAEDIREQIKSVFESLDEDNQQLMIEMIEDQDYDTIIEVVKEVSNG